MGGLGFVVNRTRTGDAELRPGIVFGSAVSA